MVISPLYARAAAPNIEALRRGLHDLGLDEERDFTFALRFLDGNLALAPAVAAEKWRRFGQPSTACGIKRYLRRAQLAALLS